MSLKLPYWLKAGLLIIVIDIILLALSLSWFKNTLLSSLYFQSVPIIGILFYRYTISMKLIFILIKSIVLFFITVMLSIIFYANPLWEKIQSISLTLYKDYFNLSNKFFLFFIASFILIVSIGIIKTNSMKDLGYLAFFLFQWLWIIAILIGPICYLKKVRNITFFLICLSILSLVTALFFLCGFLVQGFAGIVCFSVPYSLAIVLSIIFNAILLFKPEDELAKIPFQKI